VYCREILIPYCTDNAILQDPWAVVEEREACWGGIFGGWASWNLFGFHSPNWLQALYAIPCKKRARMAGPEGEGGRSFGGLVGLSGTSTHFCMKQVFP
jgi:hypothetical protein